MAEVDGVLDDVDLVGEIGRDVDRGVGDDQRVVVPRNIHHKAVADARAVRMPVSRATTAPINSSVCRLPFIRASALPSRTSSTALAAESWLCADSQWKA